MKKLDRKMELIKRQQAELNRRNEIEGQIVQLICEGKHTETMDLLETLDDSVLAELQEEFEAIEASETNAEPEEKIKLILEAMQGITYLEWKKLRHCIDVRFDADVNKAANKMLLPDVCRIIETYKHRF